MTANRPAHKPGRANRLAGALVLGFVAVAALPARGADAPLSWKQTDHSLALTQGETILWQHTYNKAEGKPYFHPVTVAGSDSLTDLRPADHIWHRALWFSWKLINGLNYWEEDKKTGKAQGETEIVTVKATPNDDHSARFELALAYHPPGQPPVLTERRIVEVTPPSADGAWSMDWVSTFTAGGADVVLDRTPVTGEAKGVPHGGYAGLSLRINPALKGWKYAGSEGAAPMQQGRGSTKARWMSFGGALPDGKAAAMIVMDHPSSFRHPTSWYLIQGMPYFSPAVLFSSPYTLPAGKSFTLRYRLLFQPSAVDPAVVEKQWKQFAEEVVPES